MNLIFMDCNILLYIYILLWSITKFLSISLTYILYSHNKYFLRSTFLDLKNEY